MIGRPRRVFPGNGQVVVLEYEAADVLCADVYTTAPLFKPSALVLEESDLLILDAPHPEYRSLECPETTPVIDIRIHYGGGTPSKRVDSFVSRTIFRAEPEPSASSGLSLSPRHPFVVTKT